jgi:DNA-binding transcriptional LysR family regulator
MAVDRKTQELLSGKPIIERPLDPILLRTFLVIAQGHSFSEASRKLAMRQSTVSDHIRRLEHHLGRQVFARDTHSVALTKDGEALVGYARQILDTCERAERYFAGTRLRGRLRFGATEDLVASFLPDILEEFTRQHPEIDLELTVALSTRLVTRFEAGELDLVFCKRWPGETRGELVWRDEIVWVGRADSREKMSNAEEVILPLILYPPPSITRSIIIAALTEAEMAWRVACTSDTLTGLTTAVSAGLGLMVLARRLVPANLVILDDRPSLPSPGQLDFVLLRGAPSSQTPIAEMAAAILSKSRPG